MDEKFYDGYVRIEGLCGFSLADTLECGQAFRWNSDENGIYKGFACGKGCRAKQEGDDLYLYGVTEKDYKEFWRGYFDIERDYGALREAFCSDATLAEAVKFAPGIRVLRQEPWEALCSFIISQNNNIKRIKGIVERLCENFGERCGEYFSFPSAERLMPLSEDDLAPLRCGFRAGYILDAAKKVGSGEIDLEKLKETDSESAKAELMKIRGVGPKVAECTLLYGFGRLERFPVDVWIKRAMERYFPGGLPDCAKEYAGIAQQYIFHYTRMNESKEPAGI